MNKSRRRKPIKPLQPQEQYRINTKIKATEVRVIGESGEQIGIKPVVEALELAKEAGLDLVEVAANVSPPVCKIIDYGKFKYRLQKKEASARKNRTDNTVKELKLRYCTDTGDLETKLRQARKFLADGSKVKFSMRFRGRERAFTNLGQKKLDDIVKQLSDVANLEESSLLKGSQLHIVLGPN